jgi:hypothetical protein
MENNKDLSRDLFLCEQNICNIAGKLVKKSMKNMKTMERVFECGCLKTRTKFFSTMTPGLKSKEACRVVTCLS